MERIDPQHVSRLVWIEHCHRYHWAASLARGNVIDAGCGIGYGSAILMSAPGVMAYRGVDISPAAIKVARARYLGERITFTQGDLMDLPVTDQSIDTVVCLEVLEHLNGSCEALREFRRVLRPDGVLIGSVPSAEFDELCETTYGHNPYHKSRYSLEQLVDEVEHQFAHVGVVHATLELASVLRPVHGQSPETLDTEASAQWPTPLGSLLFVASNEPFSARVSAEVQRTRVMPALPLVKHEAETLKPRLQTIRDQTNLIDERDTYIRQLEAAVQERDARLRLQVDPLKQRNGKR